LIDLDYWRGVLSNLGQNLLRTWFLWVFVAVVYPSLAALVILYAERRANNNTVSRYWDAIYFVVACMTIGTNITPKSGWAKATAILSGVIGIIFLGLMVWLITVSF